jgi:hypothetical protein
LLVLRAWAGLSTVLTTVLVVSAFTTRQRPRWEEIDVERINIVEKDGTIRLILTNLARAPDPVMSGKTYPNVRRNSGGMYFYNESGDEVGGLIFGGRAEGDAYAAGAGLMFDRWKQDQVVGLQYQDANGRHYAGLRVWDRPDAPLAELMDEFARVQAMQDGPAKDSALAQLRSRPAGAGRVFVGRDRNKSAILDLADAQGRTRLRLVVDSAGAARVEFLDENGRALRSISATGN